MQFVYRWMYFRRATNKAMKRQQAASVNFEGRLNISEAPRLTTTPLQIKSPQVTATRNCFDVFLRPFGAYSKAFSALCSTSYKSRAYPGPGGWPSHTLMYRRRADEHSSDCKTQESEQVPRNYGCKHGRNLPSPHSSFIRSLTALAAKRFRSASSMPSPISIPISMSLLTNLPRV